MIAAPLRRAQDKNARGLIERVRRLRPFQSADVGGSTPRIEGWRGGSRLSKPRLVVLAHGPTVDGVLTSFRRGRR